MANYYWVGGSGTWDTVTTTNWSSASGGAGGAPSPGRKRLAGIVMEPETCALWFVKPWLM